MAIYGKDNIIEMVRYQKTPFWSIAETQNSKVAGNYVAKYDFEGDNPSLEDSLSQLRITLNRLTPGQYFFKAAFKKDANKNNIDCTIVIDSGTQAAVAGIGAIASKPIYIDGIGEVNADNIGDAMERKFKQLQEEADRKRKEKELEDENKRLKKELEDKESGINNGLFSIGTMFWPQLKKSAVAKDLIKTIAGIGIVKTPDAPTTPIENHAVGAAADAQARIEAALTGLLGPNPDDPAAQAKLAQELEMLAKVKKEDPDTYQTGIDYLQNI